MRESDFMKRAKSRRDRAEILRRADSERMLMRGADQESQAMRRDEIAFEEHADWYHNNEDNLNPATPPPLAPLRTPDPQREDSERMQMQGEDNLGQAIRQDENKFEQLADWYHSNEDNPYGGSPLVLSPRSATPAPPRAATPAPPRAATPAPPRAATPARSATPAPQRSATPDPEFEEELRYFDENYVHLLPESPVSPLSEWYQDRELERAVITPTSDASLTPRTPPPPPPPPPPPRPTLIAFPRATTPWVQQQYGAAAEVRVQQGVAGQSRNFGNYGRTYSHWGDGAGAGAALQTRPRAAVQSQNFTSYVLQKRARATEDLLSNTQPRNRSRLYGSAVPNVYEAQVAMARDRANTRQQSQLDVYNTQRVDRYNTQPPVRIVRQTSGASLRPATSVADAAAAAAIPGSPQPYVPASRVSAPNPELPPTNDDND